MCVKDYEVEGRKDAGRTDHLGVTRSSTVGGPWGVGLEAASPKSHVYQWSYREPRMKELQLKDAKVTLSAAIDRALAGEPTVITRHGRKEAVIVSFAEWERVTKVPSFADVLLTFRECRRISLGSAADRRARCATSDVDQLGKHGS
jgi:antitoxin Phd